MPYPEELKKLIEVVESTREDRVKRKKAGEEIPFLSLDERKERLNYHPDFKSEGRRELAVGPSKGKQVPHEIADLLEARSRLDPDKADLTQVDPDASLLGFLRGLCLAGERHSAVLIEIALDRKHQPFSG